MPEAKFLVTINIAPETEEASVEKSDDLSLVKGAVIKAEAEQRFTLCVAYPSNRADVGVAADRHRDFAGTKATEEAAWSYLTKSPKVGLWHADGTEGAGCVVESYIYRRDDPWIIKAVDGSEQRIEPGDWLLGIQWDPATFEAIKSGHIGGISPQGRAKRRMPSPEAVANLRS
jgi:hypothetical protein